MLPVGLPISRGQVLKPTGQPAGRSRLEGGGWEFIPNVSVSSTQNKWICIFLIRHPGSLNVLKVLNLPFSPLGLKHQLRMDPFCSLGSKEE